MAWNRSVNTVLGRAEYEAMHSYAIVPGDEERRTPHTITDIALGYQQMEKVDSGWLQDRIELLIELLQRLQPEAMDLLKASVLEEKKSDEIAAEKGISSGAAVRKRLEKIRRDLIAEFEQAWQDRFPGESMWQADSRANTVSVKDKGKKKRGKLHALSDDREADEAPGDE